MASHFYLQYNHPMQGCPAIDPSAGILGYSLKTTGHRKLEQKHLELVNKREQADSRLRDENARLVIENTSLRSERDNDAKERGKLRRENEKHKAHINKLQSQFQTSQKYHENVMSESIEKDKTIDLYQEEIKEFEREKIEAKGEYDKLNRWALRVQREQYEANQKVNDLEKALERKDTQYIDNNESWTKKNKIQDEYIAYCEKRLQEYELENKKLKEKSDAHEPDLNPAKVKSESIEGANEIDLYRKQIKDFEREKIEAQNESKTFRALNLVVRKERDQVNRQVHNLQEALKLKDTQYADNSKNYNELMKKTTALCEKEISKLQSKLNEYKLEIENLRKQNEDLKHE